MLSFYDLYMFMLVQVQVLALHLFDICIAQK